MDVTRAVLDDYQRALRDAGALANRPPSPASRNVTVTALRGFFGWLTEHSAIPSNPAARLERVRIGRRLPRHVLSAAEAEAVLAQPFVSRALGLRDRAILETLYSTGIRRAELAHLDLEDVDHARGLLIVRAGKFQRDRVVPIGERALGWIDRYAARVRRRVVSGREERALFVSRRGSRLSVSALSHLVNGYVLAAALGKAGACHLFRHTMATVMLDNGADLRSIQQILGHASLATTQIYTHVSVGALKRIHEKTHPAAFVPAGASARARKPRRGRIPGRRCRRSASRSGDR